MQHSNTFLLSKSIILIVILFTPFNSFAQSSFVPVNDKEYYHLLDRLSIKEPLSFSFFHSSVKPVERKSIALLADSVLQDTTVHLSGRDIFNLDYLTNDNSEWSKHQTNKSRKPVLKYFYQNKSDLLHVSTKDFDLHLNPVLYFSVGKETVLNTSTYINTRGVELRGMINRKVGFYTFFADNQAVFPYYVGAYGNFPFTPGVPGEGYTKPFKKNGVDFITARGYFTFNLIKNIQVQFGHDKHFIGNGYRSLILSDFGSNYTFLKVNTYVWKINYLNIFAEMNAQVFYANKLLPKKYFAFHHLSYDVTKNINIGFFESIIFGSRDSTKIGQFDINYLNPVIFYRSIEQQLGSPDNALLGMDIRVNFLRHFSCYGQLILDEFVLHQVLSGKGRWDNKQAGQVGIKYIDAAGIRNLDLQAEMNIVRPYTYTHKDNFRSYTHYNQPLAHPLGANFVEFVGIARCQPINKLRITGKIIYADYGMDTSFTSGAIDNFGQNIYKSYIGVDHYRLFGNKIGQGISTKLMYTSINFTYQLKHNLFFDFTYIYRKSVSAIPVRSYNTNFASISFRWNIPQRLNEF